MNKRTAVLLWIMSILVIGAFTACDNPTASNKGGGGFDDGSPTDGSPAPRLTIHGNVASNLSGSAVTANSDGLKIETALLYSLSGGYPVNVPVNSDGSFLLPIEELEPAGIVFVGPGNSYRGHVAFGSATNAMPLHVLDSEVQVYDLGNLRADTAPAERSGRPFSVEHNFDSHMSNVSGKERNALAAQAALFSAVIENPDFDGNGIVDLLESKQLRPGFAYYSGALGSFGDSLKPHVTGFDPDNFGHKFLFDINYPTALGDVTITLPDNESGGTRTETANHGSPEGTLFFHGPGGAVEGFPGLPQPGVYSLAANPSEGNAINYQFRVAEGVDQLIADNAIALVPEVTLNPNGTIHSLSWQAHYPDMTPVEDIRSIVTKVEVQIDTVTGGRAYDSGWLPATTVTHTLENQNISWDEVQFLFMVYDDHFTNHYVNTYPRNATP